MRIATWNVNSLRVRLPQLAQWVASAQPDVVALQETKTTDEQFPRDEIVALGYHCVFAGQKSYNGVALLSRTPATDVVTQFPGFDDPQRRVLAATVDGVRVVNFYVPNGSEVGSEKYAYKLQWLQHARDFLAAQLEHYPRLVVLGDFNIAPDDRDVYDPATWKDQVLCSAPERAALQRIAELGLSDVLRQFTQEPGLYSWWDYRQAAFRRNLGLRIDLILASPALSALCTACHIEKEPRKWERPTDHAPVVAEFNLT